MASLSHYNATLATQEISQVKILVQSGFMIFFQILSAILKCTPFPKDPARLLQKLEGVNN